jgi:IclR family KDG regulon transcriptional repressor
MLRTVSKIGPVLDLFTVERSEWGVSEVAETLGSPTSSVHALLSSLADVGLLACTPQGRYRLGWRVLALAETLRATVDLRAVALPVLRELNERFHETVHLAVLDRGQALYVEKLEGTRQVRVAGVRAGTRLLAHSSGVGKVLLADRTEGEVRHILALDGVRKYTTATVTGMDDILRELADVRRQGYAYDWEQMIPDCCCVAAPVHDANGRVAAAVSVTVPSYRFRPRVDEFRAAVVAAGREVSMQLTESQGGSSRAPALA